MPHLNSLHHATSDSLKSSLQTRTDTDSNSEGDLHLLQYNWHHTLVVRCRELMIQRGKREGTRSRPVWREERGGERRGRGVRQTRGQWSVCGVWRSLSKCEGKCVYVIQCVSAIELGFALLTSHTFPPVTKGKYIHTPKCTVIQHARGCPDCLLYALHCMCICAHGTVCMCVHCHHHSVCRWSWIV